MSRLSGEFIKQPLAIQLHTSDTVNRSKIYLKWSNGPINKVDGELVPFHIERWFCFG